MPMRIRHSRNCSAAPTGPWSTLALVKGIMPCQRPSGIILVCLSARLKAVFLLLVVDEGGIDYKRGVGGKQPPGKQPGGE